jgi:hypothetical protein
MKTVMIMFAALSITAFSSCKKDWVCGCTDQSGNYTAHTINDEKLLDARSKCKSMNYDNTVLGIHTSQSCSIQ